VLFRNYLNYIFGREVRSISILTLTHPHFHKLKLLKTHYLHISFRVPVELDLHFRVG